jgi:hypothetical protein
LAFKPNWGGAILASTSFFSQIPHQENSEISVGILCPTVSVFLVQSQGACLFCWAILYHMHLFYVSFSHQKGLVMKRNCP